MEINFGRLTLTKTWSIRERSWNDIHPSNRPIPAEKGKTEEHIDVFNSYVSVVVLTHLSFGLYVEPFFD